MELACRLKKEKQAKQYLSGQMDLEYARNENTEAVLMRYRELGGKKKLIEYRPQSIRQFNCPGAHWQEYRQDNGTSAAPFCCTMTNQQRNVALPRKVEPVW